MNWADNYQRAAVEMALTPFLRGPVPSGTPNSQYSRWLILKL